MAIPDTRDLDARAVRAAIVLLAVGARLAAVLSLSRAPGEAVAA